jgi:rRNA-processing protein FCF1
MRISLTEQPIDEVPLPNDDRAQVIHSLDQLLRSKEAAMVPDEIYEELEKTCEDARNAAEAGDLEEARRLFLFAVNLLEAEDNITGTE